MEYNRVKLITSTSQDPTTYPTLHHEYHNLNIGPSKLRTIDLNLEVLGAPPDDEIILYWDQRKYKRTIWLDPGQTNTATIQSAPGYSYFTAFSANLDELDDAILAYQVPLVSDEDEQDPQQPTHASTYGV